MSVEKASLFVRFSMMVGVLILLAGAGCGSSSGGSTTATTATTTTTPGTSQSPSVSNGERIYLHGTSASGMQITYSDAPNMMMQGPLSCATCHGANGHGGSIYVMMQSYDAPDITWAGLTGQHHDHQPYTVETVKWAITEGIDPAGNPLEYPMPRWLMSASDLNDLVSYMMTLK